MKKNTKDEGWQGFLTLCTKIKTTEDFDRLFGLFLTSQERTALIGRYLIVTALIKGEQTQREIAETHKVSIGQITRGSNGLKIIDQRLKQLLEETI